MEYPRAKIKVHTAGAYGQHTKEEFDATAVCVCATTQRPAHVAHDRKCWNVGAYRTFIACRHKYSSMQRFDRVLASAQHRALRRKADLPPDAPDSRHENGACCLEEPTLSQPNSSVNNLQRRAKHPADCCHVFETQAKAFDYADKINAVSSDVDPSRHVLPFAREIVNGHGKKIFIVTSIAHIRQCVVETKSKQRHFQEIIREHQPCHLYFDLEFQRACNSGVNGEALTAALVKHVIQSVHDDFAITCDPTHFIQLDSSTKTKFSRHLIVRLPGNAAFSHNGHVRVFVDRMLDRLDKTPLKPENSSQTSTLFSEFILQKEDGGTTCFVDTSVYSRNRHFRMYGSCKAGKDAFLTMAASNSYIFKCKSSAVLVEFEQEVFEAALICNVDQSPHLLSYDSVDARTMPEGRVRHTWRNKMSSFNVADGTVKEGLGPSPYPALDALISRAALPGHIRKCDRI